MPDVRRELRSGSPGDLRGAGIAQAGLGQTRKTVCLELRERLPALRLGCGEPGGVGTGAGGFGQIAPYLLEARRQRERQAGIALGDGCAECGNEQRFFGGGEGLGPGGEEFGATGDLRQAQGVCCEERGRHHTLRENRAGISAAANKLVQQPATGLTGRHDH